MEKQLGLLENMGSTGGSVGALGSNWWWCRSVGKQLVVALQI